MLPKIKVLISRCKQSIRAQLHTAICKLFNKQTVTVSDVIIKVLKVGLPLAFILAVCFMVGSMVIAFIIGVLPIPPSITTILNSFAPWQMTFLSILSGVLVISGTVFGFNLIMSKTGKTLLSSIIPKPKPKATSPVIPPAISAKYPRLSAILSVLIYTKNIVTGAVRAVKHIAEFKLAEDPKLKP
jgi:hypothetical protein